MVLGPSQLRPRIDLHDGHNEHHHADMVELLRAQSQKGCEAVNSVGIPLAELRAISLAVLGAVLGEIPVVEPPPTAEPAPLSSVS